MHSQLKDLISSFSSAASATDGEDSIEILSTNSTDPLDTLRSIYEVSGPYVDLSTVFSVANRSQAILTKIITFCLFNFVALLSTVGALAYQAILYLCLVYYFLDFDHQILTVSLNNVTMKPELREKVSQMT